MDYQVGIIGCGLIGQKRAQQLHVAQQLGTAHLVVCADLILERAQTLAKMHPGAQAVTDWRQVIDHPGVNIVIASTTNSALAEITLAAVQAGKHVLVEKPAATSTAELDNVISTMERSGVQVRVGFNHRCHPALQKAHELYRNGAVGELMFLRGRYGHGGRVGYEKEWRSNPALSGGGELIDQGVHLIDLARWFLGDFSEVSGFAHTYYWQMPVDDNAFMLLKTPRGQAAFLHVSCTEWKNTFSLEIYGREGKLQIDGLGGSYGTERLAYYRMLPQMGPPETTIWEYPMGDNSWQQEFEEFIEDIHLGRTPSANLYDARAVLAVVEKIYAESGYDYHTQSIKS